MKKMMKVMVCLLVLAAAGTAVTAQEQTKVRKAPEHETDMMGMKLVRGITNVATGAGEFPRQILRSGEEDGLLLALPYGLARGLTMTFVRIGYGVLETVFFFVPFDGGYSSMLNPAYVWEKEAPPTVE